MANRKEIEEKLQRARQKALAKGIRKAEESLASTQRFVKLSGSKNVRLGNIVKRKKQSLKELRMLR